MRVGEAGPVTELLDHGVPANETCQSLGLRSVLADGASGRGTLPGACLRALSCQESAPVTSASGQEVGMGCLEAESSGEESM